MENIWIIVFCVVLVIIVVVGVVLVMKKSHHSDKSMALRDSPGQYKQTIFWKGTDLRPESNKGWAYFTETEPTHGSVYYGVHPELMTDLGNGSIKIAVSPKVTWTSDKKPHRNAIRIYTKQTFKYGLFAISINHIPAGMGVWPSWWLTGTGSHKWACQGEIDIIEGMGRLSTDPKFDPQYKNKTTLHTNTPIGGKQCMQNGVRGISNVSCNYSSGKYHSCGCSGTEPCPDHGCGVVGPPNSFGAGFNNVYGKSGAVYVCELTPNGRVSVWFMTTDDAKKYLTSNPDVTKFPAPYVKFNACPGQFQNMEMIINTTLCGDWQFTDQCFNSIGDARNTMPEAYWTINWISVYQ